jgi:CHAD domain-containing protein
VTQRQQCIEQEVKLAAALNFVVPDFSKIVGRTTSLPAQSLCTTYFDTPDMRLWKCGLTLRHRLGELRDAGKWTLKLPEAGNGRALERTELSWDGGRDRFPEEATRLLYGVTCQATLSPMVELESARRRLVLHDTAGSPLGEIDDDIVTVKSGSRKGFTFRQIELEFSFIETDADKGSVTVDAVLNELKEGGAIPDGEQKLSKSLGLGATSKAQSKLAKKGRTFPIAAVVQSSIAEGLTQLLINDVRLRLDPLDPPLQAIHQARVASRRLRSDLMTFKPVLNLEWLDRTKNELKWLGEALGQVRDVDVLAERFLDDEPAGSPKDRGHAAFTAVLDRQRKAASLDLEGTLRSDRYLKLLKQLHHDADAPPLKVNASAASRIAKSLALDDSAIDILPSLVRAQWQTLHQEVRKAGDHPNAKQMHRIRIASKQLRYAAEAAGPVVGKDARRLAKRAEHLQTILGEHHDAVIAENWIFCNFSHTPVATTFEARQVSAQQMIQQEMSRRWTKAWATLHRKRVLHWLGHSP